MHLARWRVPAGILVGAVLLVAGWCAWQAWQVNRDLSAAADDAARLQAAVSDGNGDAADAALAQLQAHSTSAADRTDGPTWSAFTHLPRYGDDATGVRVVSETLASLSNDGIEPLVRTSSDLESLLPKDGKISIDAVTRLQQPVSHGSAVFAAADKALAAQDPSGYVGALRDQYRELASRVSQAAAVLKTSDTALQVMPSMLGGDGPRNYLLVFQNNAEIRATGGLPGAVSLVTARDGKVRMSRQVAAGSFGETAKPVLPLTAAELAIYDRQLGTYFLDANLTPDFPRTADLMRARWEQEYPEHLDGVISLDPVALSYILKAMGPVQVGDLSLTSENAVDLLLHEVYLRYPSPLAQDAWFRQVARAVFDRVSSGVQSPQDLVRALARGADEDRIYVHSFHDEEQQTLAASQVAGSLVTDPAAAPQVGVSLNDATGAKMSYYLRFSVGVSSTYCRAGSQGLSGKAHLLSDAPDDAASLPDYVTGAGLFGTAPGSQLVLVRLFGPVDGKISDVELNGRPIRAAAVVQDGRPVITTVALLKPGFTVDLTWRMVTGPGQTGDTAVRVTPGVTPKRTSSVAATSCS